MTAVSPFVRTVAVLAGLLPMLIGPAAARAQLEPGPLRPDIRVAPEHTEWLNSPVEKAAGAFTVPAVLWSRGEDVEVLACGERGREHETILLINLDEKALYAALGEAGALVPAGFSMQPESVQAHRGMRISLEVALEDDAGQWQWFLAEDLIREESTRAVLPPLGWRCIAPAGVAAAAQRRDDVEINLTYDGLHGDAFGLVEWAWARQPFASALHVRTDWPGLAPGQTGRKARLRFAVVSETEALDRALRIRADQSRWAQATGKPMPPGRLNLLEQLRPLAVRADALRGSLLKVHARTQSLMLEISRVAEAGTDPESAQGRALGLRLRSMQEARQCVEQLLSSTYLEMDLLAMAAISTEPIPASLQRENRVEIALRMLRQMRDGRDEAHFRALAAAWRWHALQLQAAPAGKAAGVDAERAVAATQVELAGADVWDPAELKPVGLLRTLVASLDEPPGPPGPPRQPQPPGGDASPAEPAAMAWPEGLDAAGRLRLAQGLAATAALRADRIGTFAEVQRYERLTLADWLFARRLGEGHALYPTAIGAFARQEDLLAMWTARLARIDAGLELLEVESQILRSTDAEQRALLEGIAQRLRERTAQTSRQVELAELRNAWRDGQFELDRSVLLQDSPIRLNQIRDRLERIEQRIRELGGAVPTLPALPEPPDLGDEPDPEPDEDSEAMSGEPGAAEGMDAGD